MEKRQKMHLKYKNTYKKRKILTLIFIVAMLVIDFVQYDIDITSHIYTGLLVGVLLFSVLTEKISKNYIWIFILFLLFQDMSRYFYSGHNFNSLFLGSFKYVFIGFTILIGIYKGISDRKKIIVYMCFALVVLIISIIKGQVNGYIAKDIVFYFNLFLLPILISCVLSSSDCYKLIKLYDVFVYAFPIFTLLLLLLNRTYNICGSLYTTVGSISLMNIAYLVGQILKKNNKFDLIQYIYIFAYLGVYFVSPSSGGILVLIAIGIYYVIKRSSNVNIAIRWIAFISLFTIIILATVLIFNYIIESPKYSGTFTRFKVLQIQYTFQAKSLAELPFSVRIRAAEVLNVVRGDNIIDIIFGRGFGGFFRDNLNIFGIIEQTDNAFSLEELASGQYYWAHFILTNIFLKFGLIGLVLFIQYAIEAYKSINKNYAQFIPVLGVVLYACGYGVKLIILFGFIYGAIIKLNRGQGYASS